MTEEQPVGMETEKIDVTDINMEIPQKKRKRKKRINGNQQSVLEKNEQHRRKFMKDFQNIVNNDFFGKDIIVVCLATGKSGAKENNMKALKEVSKFLKKENKNKDIYVNCQFNLEALQRNKYGVKREKKYDFAVYNLLENKGAYKVVFKKIEQMFEHTKIIVLFVPGKIYKFLDKSGYHFQHFTLVRNCVLEDIKKPGSISIQKRQKMKRHAEDEKIDDQQPKI